MRRFVSLAASAAVAAIVTHGMVYSGLHFDDLTGSSFFRYLLLEIERLWSALHGWPPLTRIRDFGPFYARAVHLVCPILGFSLFWILSRRRVGIHLWKPVAISLLLAIPLGYIDRISVEALPFCEAARTLLVLAVMLWSVDPVRLRGRVQAALQS